MARGDYAATFRRKGLNNRFKNPADLILTG